MKKQTKTVNEIELNFEITDLDGLLKQLKSQSKETTFTVKFHYFESFTDKSFYIRTEEIECDGSSNKKLTIKYNFNDDSNNGLKRRAEMSTEICDVDYFIKFFSVIGLQYLGSKAKTRHHFNIDNLEVTVDEWNTKELGNRLEIEGHDENKIIAFKDELIKFIKA